MQGNSDSPGDDLAIDPPAASTHTAAPVRDTRRRQSQQVQGAEHSVSMA